MPVTLHKELLTCEISLMNYFGPKTLKKSSGNISQWIYLSQWIPFFFAHCLQYLSTPLRIHIMKHPLGSPGLDLNKWDEWFRFRLLFGPFFFPCQRGVLYSKDRSTQDALGKNVTTHPEFFWDKNPRALTSLEGNSYSWGNSPTISLRIIRPTFSNEALGSARSYSLRELKPGRFFRKGSSRDGGWNLQQTPRKLDEDLGGGNLRLDVWGTT